MKADKTKHPKGGPSPNGGVSRRDFLRTTALGAGAAAAGLRVARGADVDSSPAADRKITIPKEIPDSRAQDPSPADFPMNGAQVFAKTCKEEGLAALFCAPGNYSLINALASEGIPTYGGRTEGGMCAAADAFIRVTGEIAACSGTEGPGFTHMIMNIGSANAARTPLLVIASNKSVANDDTESGIQTVYQQPTTEGMKKYGKRLITPNRVYEYAGYAFRQLKSGVPGPVHLDFPGEVYGARFEEPSQLKDYFVPATEKRYDATKYRTESRPAPSAGDVRAAVELIQRAERPMIVASAGVFYHKAWEPLRQLAEKADIAVVESGPSRGHFPDDHRLSASTAPDALLSADLVIFVGQYCMPPYPQFRFSAEARYVRIDPKAEDIGRNWPIDLGIVSDERAALEALAEAVPKMSRDTWAAELAAARKAFEDENEEYYQLGLKHSAATGTLHPAIIGKELADFLYKGGIPKEQTTVASGGYGIGRYTRRYLRAFRPGQICNGAYQYGAIGPDVGYTFGVAAAVQNGVGPQAPYKGAPVIGITGDAGFGYSGMEIETLSKYRLPAVLIVYNNNAWGVWTSGMRAARALHMYLFQENLRYDKVAEGLGGRGEYVTRPEDFAPALKRSYEIAAADGLSTVINCQAIKEFWNGRQYPPGMPQNVEPGCMAYYH